jgi:hypothetical protein
MNKANTREVVHDKTIERTVVKPYTTKELAQLFNMSARTLRRNIAGIKAKIGKRKGYFFSVEQVQMIFDQMGGAPYEVTTTLKNNEESSDNKAA